MPSRDLRVDTAGVHAAGATTAAAASAAAPTAAALTPCAGDATSVQIATRAGGQIGALGLATTAANLSTDAAAAHLHDDAGAYELQEASGATRLGEAAVAVSTGADAPRVSAPHLPPAPQLREIPAGIMPTSGREIAAVIHSGPGPQGVLAMAAQLEGTAADLDAAATSVSAAGALAADSWTSDAADAAGQHLVTLQSDYTEQATQARALAQQLRAHADDFSRAKAQIPPPQRFADLEARLLAAYAANAHPTSMGRYTQTITDLQYALAAANNDAINGYARYRQAAEIQAGTMDPHANPESGGSKPHAAPDGAGGTEDSDNAGQDGETRSPTDALTVPPADPAGADGLGGVAGGLMGTVLPAILGGVSGAAGGLLGTLSGAGQQLQQAGSQLAGGFAQAANAAAGEPKSADSGGGGQPQMPRPDGLDAGGGGPEPGDMEPAGGVGAAGPLAAPEGAPAVPTAAPATFSAAPSATTGAAGGMPGGGAMMPPMMPMGGHPSGSGEDDRRLYPERRVRIETPPNSEPVKGRREARRTRGEKVSDAEASR
jgi:PPE family